MSYYNPRLKYPITRGVPSMSAAKGVSFPDLTKTFLDASMRTMQIPMNLRVLEDKMVHPLRSASINISTTGTLVKQDSLQDISMEALISTLEDSRRSLARTIERANALEMAIAFPNSVVAKEISDCIQGIQDRPQLDATQNAPVKKATYSMDRNELIADINEYLNQAAHLESRLNQIAEALDAPESDSAKDIHRHWKQYSEQAYTPALAPAKR